MPTTDAAPDVGDLTDTELLDAMDQFGSLFGMEEPEGTMWSALEGYGTGSFREAVRQYLAERRAIDAQMNHAVLVPAAPPLASPLDDDSSFPF